MGVHAPFFAQMNRPDVIINCARLMIRYVFIRTTWVYDMGLDSSFYL
ncbi:MAG: hypothetical protein LUE65_10155 [Clostridiales bacterium]|nr:hypothetical protein [Clostridiales bacterium]